MASEVLIGLFYGVCVAVPAIGAFDWVTRELATVPRPAYPRAVRTAPRPKPARQPDYLERAS